MALPTPASRSSRAPWGATKPRLIDLPDDTLPSAARVPSSQNVYVPAPPLRLGPTSLPRSANPHFGSHRPSPLFPAGKVPFRDAPDDILACSPTGKLSGRGTPARPSDLCGVDPPALPNVNGTLDVTCCAARRPIPTLMVLFPFGEARTPPEISIHQEGAPQGPTVYRG